MYKCGVRNELKIDNRKDKGEPFKNPKAGFERLEASKTRLCFHYGRWCIYILRGRREN